MIVNFACVCVRMDYEPAVQNGLAVTPSMMSDLASKGIPVSSQNANSYTYDEQGISVGDFGVPIDFQRGVDIADVWEAQKSARKFYRKAKKNAVVEPKSE